MFLAEADVPWAYFIQASGAQFVISIFQNSTNIYVHDTRSPDRDLLDIRLARGANSHFLINHSE